MKLRRIIFLIHLTLGILTGLVGGLLAGTAVIMAFADSYLDVREGSKRRVIFDPLGQMLTLEEMASRVRGAHSGVNIDRIGIESDTGVAVEFYHGKTGLDYVNPMTGQLSPSDVVPLRRSLHKGVEQWHRFFGRSGDAKKTGQQLTSWFNVAFIPLLLSGLVLWCPRRLRWPFFRGALIPLVGGRIRGTERSWHTSLGFWSAPVLLVMVVTGSLHSFEWVRNTAQEFAGSSEPRPGSTDSLWAPGLPKQAVPPDSERLSWDELRALADREMGGWTRLDVFAAPLAKPGERTGTARLVGQAPGWGPGFFPIVIQVNPYTGAVLDIHSWKDLSPRTRLLAWNRWLHKGEAFGRTGQIIAGLACMVMLVLIYTGWALAIRRLLGAWRVERE